MSSTSSAATSRNVRNVSRDEYRTGPLLAETLREIAHELLARQCDGTTVVVVDPCAGDGRLLNGLRGAKTLEFDLAPRLPEIEPMDFLAGAADRDVYVDTYRHKYDEELAVPDGAAGDAVDDAASNAPSAPIESSACSARSTEGPVVANLQFW